MNSRSYATTITPTKGAVGLQKLREYETFSNVIIHIANPETLMLAYEEIKSKDGLSIAWIHKTSKKLKRGLFEKFQNTDQCQKLKSKYSN